MVTHRGSRLSNYRWRTWKWTAMIPTMNWSRTTGIGSGIGDDFAGFPKCPVIGKFSRTDRYGHSLPGVIVFGAVFSGLLLPRMV
jgi:hypothetical protein